MAHLQGKCDLISQSCWTLVLNPDSYYDLVLEDPKNGNLFLARDASGNILLSKKSSKGQTLTKIDNQNVVTTIWTASCDGRMAVGTTTTQYVWAVSGLYTVAQTGDASAAKPFILIAKTTTSSKNKKRNEYQDGAYHRCIEQPRPLVADTAVTPKRPAQSNGCGSGSTAAWVPDLDFGHCCDGHDLCYGMSFPCPPVPKHCFSLLFQTTAPAVSRTSATTPSWTA